MVNEYPVGHCMNPKVVRVPKGVKQVPVMPHEKTPKFVRENS